MFTIVFTLEIFAKFLAFPIEMFVKDSYTLFDCVIVAFSLAELAIGVGGKFVTGLRILRLFRSLRMLRFFRMFKMGDMKIISTVLVGAFKPIANFIVLVLLYIFLFMVVGMYLFAGTMSFDDDGF